MLFVNKEGKPNVLRTLLQIRANTMTYLASFGIKQRNLRSRKSTCKHVQHPTMTSSAAKPIAPNCMYMQNEIKYISCC